VVTTSAFDRATLAFSHLQLLLRKLAQKWSPLGTVGSEIVLENIFYSGRKTRVAEFYSSVFFWTVEWKQWSKK